MRWVVAVAIVAVVSGCGSGTEKLPAGCTEGARAFQLALARAPGVVTVDGTPISRCFPRGADASDVQIVGTYLLTVAQDLSTSAQGGDAKSALRLGYLIGAAQRGAKRNGVSSEMVRRLEAETVGRAGVHDAYERGRKAGLRQG